MNTGDFKFFKRPSFLISAVASLGVAVVLFLAAHIEGVAFLCLFIGGGTLVVKEFMGFYASNFDKAAEATWNRWAATFALIAAIAGVPLIARTLYELVVNGDLTRVGLFA